MAMTYSVELDEGDMKQLRRMVKEHHEGVTTHLRSDAAYLEELLDIAEGLTRPAGIRLAHTDDGGVAFRWDSGERAHGL